MAEGDKSEAATPKRRGDARKKGQVAKSPDLSSIIVLTGLLLAMRSGGGAASRVIENYVKSSFLHLDNLTISPQLVMNHAGAMLIAAGAALAPVFGVALVLGVVSNMAQTGPLWAPESLRFDLMRLNPMNGLKRYLSATALVNLVKSCYKIFIIGYIAWITVSSSYPRLLLLPRIDTGEAIGIIGDLVYHMAIRISLAMLVISALDFFYQRYSFEKGLRMTKDEVRREGKDQEGNPQIKSRIKARMRQLAKKRMMEEVPAADVVITNPTHFAIALKYDSDKNHAPVVVAKGADYLAFKIREIAQMNDVPIVENPPLARAMYKQVEIGREIPADLYAAVAEVLAFVYNINQRRKERAGIYNAKTTV